MAERKTNCKNVAPGMLFDNDEDFIGYCQKCVDENDEKCTNCEYKNSGIVPDNIRTKERELIKKNTPAQKDINVAKKIKSAPLEEESPEGKTESAPLEEESPEGKTESAPLGEENPEEKINPDPPKEEVVADPIFEQSGFPFRPFPLDLKDGQFSIYDIMLYFTYEGKGCKNCTRDMKLSPHGLCHMCYTSYRKNRTGVEMLTSFYKQKMSLLSRPPRKQKITVAPTDAQKLPTIRHETADQMEETLPTAYYKITAEGREEVTILEKALQDIKTLRERKLWLRVFEKCNEINEESPEEPIEVLLDFILKLKQANILKNT